MDNVSAAFHVLAECSKPPSDIDYRVTKLEIVSTSRYTAMTRGLAGRKTFKGP